MLCLPGLLLAVCAPLLQDDAPRRPLTVADGDGWRTIEDSRLSERGTWGTYRLQPADGSDGVLHLAQTAGPARFEVPRGKGGRIDHAERFAVCLVAPARDDVRAWKKGKEEKEEEEKEEGAPAPPESEPKDALAILDLETGARLEVARVQSFRLPDERGGWLAYLLHEPEKKPEEADEPEPDPPSARRSFRPSPVPTPQILREGRYVG